MKKNTRQFLATLMTVILISALMVSVPAFAQTGTLGTETPFITSTFTDSSNNAVDGNSLETGDYTVSIRLSGMKTVSVFQLAATYTDDVTINSVATIADTDSTFSVGAIVNEDNSFVVILASENDDTSVITDGEVMVTMSVTVNTAGDFAKYFTVSSDPDLTFTEADYGDSYESCYVLVGNEETETSFPYITVDMSPEFKSGTITVSGTVMIATNDTGSASTVGITGIDVYVGATIDTANGNAIVGGELVGTTAADGTFTVEIPAGTEKLIFNGESTVPREVSLIDGNSNVTDAIIPIVICDYNHDGKINGTDSTAFMSGYASNDVYCDISGDGNWNGTDMTAYGYFIGKTVDYADLQI